MEKCVYVFSLTLLLFSLCDCFTISKCTVPPTTAATSTSGPINSTNSQLQVRRPTAIHGLASDNILANVVNASVVSFNESAVVDAATDGLRWNTSDTNIDDDPMHFPFRWEHLRERKKQQRLFTIQNRIKDLLGEPRRPNVSASSHINDMQRARMVHLFEILKDHQQTTEPHDVSAERVQSFYPSCTLPRNTDRELWEDPGRFHVFYNIPSPQLPQSTSLTVSSAKMRLFKRALDDCETENRTGELADGNGERLLISIYQYVRPFRRNRRPRKKKLVDSRMVSANYSGWLEFDIGTSIRDWLENSSKNLGLEIVMEDALGNYRQPSEYLHNMNCTEGTAASMSMLHYFIADDAGKDRPFPHFTEEITSTQPSDKNDSSASATSSSSLFIDTLQTYPTLDLRTIEVIEAENSSAIKKNELNGRRKRQTRRPNDDIIVASQDDCDNEIDLSGSDGCCGINMNVSFKEMGFDGIVAPESFHTKICVGVCDETSDDETTKEDQDSDDKMTALNATCAPSETEPLLILHYNEDGKLVIRTITDVIIKSCDCSSAATTEPMQ